MRTLSLQLHLLELKSPETKALTHRSRNLQLHLLELKYVRQNAELCGHEILQLHLLELKLCWAGVLHWATAPSIAPTGIEIPPTTHG